MGAFPSLGIAPWGAVPMHVAHLLVSLSVDLRVMCLVCGVKGRVSALLSLLCSLWLGGLLLGSGPLVVLA